MQEEKMPLAEDSKYDPV